MGAVLAELAEEERRAGRALATRAAGVRIWSKALGFRHRLDATGWTPPQKKRP